MATKFQMNSLGIAQENLENATRELKSAQTAFEKAADRLALAEETHQTATVALVSEVTTVRGNARVIPVKLK